MELTTDEVLQQSIALAWNADLREGMERILRLADLVKFAKYQPLADEHTWSMQEAVRFVHSTALLVNSGATESRTITDGGGSHAE